MRFYRKAESAATAILAAFQSGNLPNALAPIFVRRKDNVPCRAWSWSNQLITALAGHSDARGYRQWQEVGRHVKKGEKSFPILVPMVKKVTDKDTATGEEKERSFIYGFTSAPVFGLEQTDGDPLPPPDPKVTAWLDNLPLLEVAKEWGLSVDAYNGRTHAPLGKYRRGVGIALGVENVCERRSDSAAPGGRKVQRSGWKITLSLLSSFWGSQPDGPHHRAGQDAWTIATSSAATVLATTCDVGRRAAGSSHPWLRGCDTDALDGPGRPL